MGMALGDEPPAMLVNDAVAVVAAQRLEFAVDRGSYPAFFFEFAQRGLLGRLTRFIFSPWKLPLAAEVNMGMALGDEPPAMLVNDGDRYLDRTAVHIGESFVIDVGLAAIPGTQLWLENEAGAGRI